MITVLIYQSIVETKPRLYFCIGCILYQANPIAQYLVSSQMFFMVTSINEIYYYNSFSEQTSLCICCLFILIFILFIYILFYTKMSKC